MSLFGLVVLVIFATLLDTTICTAGFIFMNATAFGALWRYNTLTFKKGNRKQGFLAVFLLIATSAIPVGLFFITTGLLALKAEHGLTIVFTITWFGFIVGFFTYDLLTFRFSQISLRNQ